MANYPMLSLSAAPTDGINEIQRVTKGGVIDGGTWDLDLSPAGGPALTLIPWNVTAAQLQALVDPTLALAITVSGGPIASAAFNFTFSKNLGGRNLSELTASATNLTGAGHALTVSTPTSGLTGSFRGAQPGCILQDTTNGILYKNKGTHSTPKWEVPAAEPVWVLTP